MTSTENTILSVEELKNKGNEAYKVGNYEEAIELFTLAITHPDHVHDQQQQQQQQQQQKQQSSVLKENLPLPSNRELSKTKTGSKAPPPPTPPVEAIVSPIDVTLAILYCNRSLCYAVLQQWKLSAIDAQRAVQLHPKYIKAHYRLIKAFIGLSLLREARHALSYGFKECGEQSKELRSIEEELFQLTKIPVRPKPHDFNILQEIGTGNYSSVYKVELKATNALYAIKTIERTTIDKTSKRHPNIHNEILMEKRVLLKLDHPGIVTLYSTFQDAGTLYYLMEYLSGSDLWTHLHLQVTEEKKKQSSIAKGKEDGETISNSEKRLSSQIGLHWSQIQFYFSEMISIIEYMHRKGIVHRDIKPENMILTSSGHLKFIDYGTAKDLIETDLNGQEFVGTPEYMCPQTIASNKNTNIGIEADLWALGVVLYQMLLGVTPFAAPSPYLIFLRTKRGKVIIPSWVPTPVSSLIRSLLLTNVSDRISAATDSDIEKIIQTKEYSSLSYEKLRQHPFFTQDWFLTADYTNKLIPNELRQEQHLHTIDPEQATTVFQQEAQTIPSLHDLCLRAVGEAVIDVAFETANNGGLRPTHIPWMQQFSLSRISSLDRERVKQYLSRQEKLHIPSVYRLFFNNLPDSRCIRTSISLNNREYIGLDRELQGHYKQDYHFILLSNSLINLNCAPVETGKESAVAVGGTEESIEEKLLKSTITQINKLRPKFLMMFGNFTSSSLKLVQTGESGSEPHAMDERYSNEIHRFRRLIARVSDTIPVIFVPGEHEMGFQPGSTANPTQLQVYHSLFGCDYFGFWFQGTRGIVINSSLLIFGSQPENHLTKEYLALEEWLEEEIEQNKLCSNNVILFMYHPWYYFHENEDDINISVSEGNENQSFESIRNIPKAIRLKWLKRFRHHKIKLSFTSSQYQEQRLYLQQYCPDFVKPPATEKAESSDMQVKLKDNNSNDEDEKDTVDVEKEQQAPVDDVKEAPNEEGDSPEEEFLNEEEDAEGPKLLSIPIAFPRDSSTSASLPHGNFHVIMMREHAFQQLNYGQPQVQVTNQSNETVVQSLPSTYLELIAHFNELNH